MQEEVLSEGGLELSVGQEAGCGVGDGVGGGHERDQRLGVLADSDVHREDGQQRCCKFSSILK